jgi:hypothetical protein
VRSRSWHWSRLSEVPRLLVVTTSDLADLITIASDQGDIDAVVDYVRSLRHVDTISPLGWSRGGPRLGPYVATHRKDRWSGVARAIVLGQPERSPNS